MLRQNDLRWTQSGRRQFPSRVNRMRCLVLSLTAALVHSAQPAIAASTTWTVKTCDDSGMDSLRQIVGNARLNPEISSISVSSQLAVVRR